MIKKPQFARKDQRGIVSILVILFLITVVVFVLSQPVILSGSRSADDLQQVASSDSMYLAESGIEEAAARLLFAAEFGIPEFRQLCGELPAGGDIEVEGTKFRFVEAPVHSTPNCCNIRAQGEKDGLKRTIQKTLCVQSELGHADFGGKQPKPVVMKIKNRSSKDGVAVFNFAWRRQGSDGNTTVGNSVSAQCDNCVQPNPLWSLESSQGIPSVGSLGAGKLVARRDRVDIEVSIQEDRNFVYVGMILPGDNVQPRGSYFLDKNGGTKGPSASEYSDGNVVDGLTAPSTANPWCRHADTMILGISGKADPASNLDLSAKFTEVTLDYGSGVNQKNWTLVANNDPNYVAHFPVAGTERAWGDIFSEIYVLFNPNVGPDRPAVPAASGQVTVVSNLTADAKVVFDDSAGTLEALVAQKAAGQQIVDPVIRLRGSPAGAFIPPGTRIKLDTMRQVELGLEFQLDFRNQNGTNWTGSTPVLRAGDTVCGGICAFFSPGSNVNTPFRLRKQGGVTQWAGGFACYSGVDGAEVRPFAQITPSFGNWKEIVE
jgi:hypothetical protein